MSIRIGDLKYEFKYTDSAYTDRYYRTRQAYMEEDLNLSNFLNETITPTPSAAFRTLGDWTINASLGRGASGKVVSGTNSKGEIVTIKVMGRDLPGGVENSKRKIHVPKKLQRLTEVYQGDKSRVIRLRDE